MKHFSLMIIAWIAIMYSIVNPATAASDWDVDNLQNLQKPWTITFSEAIDVTQIPTGAIIVTNGDEPIDVQITQGETTEAIVSLQEGHTYAPNSTYTLTIMPFTSVSGAILDETVTMTFTTADFLDVPPEFLPKITATPIDAYKDQALVTLSYDDGYMNWYSKALPLHVKYNMPGTFNINTYHFEEKNDQFMYYGEVWVAADKGIEIGAHTHKHQRLEITEEVTKEQIIEDLKTNIAYLDSIDIDVKTLAAPNSVYSDEMRDIVKEHFVGVRVFGSELNTRDNYDPYWLKSYAVTNTTPLEEIKGWIDDAVENNAWLIIMLHNVVDETTPGCANGEDECDELYDISTANLEQLMAYISSFSRDELLPVSTYEGLQMTASWAQSEEQ